MDNPMPLLTIGLPVRNGQRFLHEALESVLKQDFADFRLVISDNASTDGTQSICEAAVARDTRVTYSRVESVLSISENFNRVADSLETKYFKWIADDDLMDPTFVGECVSALEEDPGAVLAYPQSIEIDETGALLGESWKPRHQSDSDRVCRRFRYLCYTRPCYEIFGVIRTNGLQRVKPQGSFVSADRVFLAELSLQGRFTEIPKPLFHHREHAGRAGLARHLRDVQPHMTPDDPNRLVAPHARLLRELLAAVGRSTLPALPKLCCYGQALRWGVRASPHIIGDVAYIAKKKVRR